MGFQKLSDNRLEIRSYERMFEKFRHSQKNLMILSQIAQDVGCIIQISFYCATVYATIK